MQFKCGITVFTGDKDRIVSRNELIEWKNYVKKECNIFEFAAGHFFIHDYYKEITQRINENLLVRY